MIHRSPAPAPPSRYCLLSLNHLVLPHFACSCVTFSPVRYILALTRYTQIGEANQLACWWQRGLADFLSSPLPSEIRGGIANTDTIPKTLMCEEKDFFTKTHILFPHFQIRKNSQLQQTNSEKYSQIINKQSLNFSDSPHSKVFVRNNSMFFFP